MAKHKLIPGYDTEYTTLYLKFPGHVFVPKLWADSELSTLTSLHDSILDITLRTSDGTWTLLASARLEKKD